MVFSPKSSRGAQTRVLPGSAILNLHLQQLPSHFGQVSVKSNGREKSYGAKSVIFAILGIFDPFSAPGGATRVFFKKNSMLCTSTYWSTTCGKISEKSNGRLSGNHPDERTNERTNATENYSPSPINRGDQQGMGKIVKRLGLWFNLKYASSVIFFDSAGIVYVYT